MIYKYKHFILNTKSRKVFDENNKELRLTGNAYRVLVFLCENGSSNITDIGGYLDGAKDYDENHMRQYRYKINTIIGSDIIEYKNNIYSMIDEIDDVVVNSSNTDLLQKNSVEFKNNMNKYNVKFSIVPAVIAIIALLLTFIDWHSYGYYTFMKFIVTGVMVYYAYYIYEVIKKIDYWFWITVGIVILFNPVIPIYLRDKSIWMLIDVLVILFLIFLITRLKRNKNI